MIYLKSKDEIQHMKKAGKIVAETLLRMEEVIKPGITTKQLDILAEEFIRSQGALPSFKGYGGFPATLCTSVNEEIIHGIPSKRVLQEGDIVSIDCGAFINGYHGDAARTFPVGKVAPEVQRLIDVTRESFFQGLKHAMVGNRLGDIGNAIQKYCEERGYSVVRDYVGHGIGREMHEDPSVPNYGRAGRGVKIMNGLCIAIEPMVNMGSFGVKELNDGWTVVTKDFQPSAHYENTIAILENGPEILTWI